MKISLSTHCEATQRASSIHDKSHFLSSRARCERSIGGRCSCKSAVDLSPPLLSIPSAFFFGGNISMAMSPSFVLSKHHCAMCLLARDCLPLRSFNPVRQPALPSETMLFYIFFFFYHICLTSSRSLNIALPLPPKELNTLSPR